MSIEPTEEFDINPFEEPHYWRNVIRRNVHLNPEIEFDGKGFICSLINSRCPVGCEFCMFGSNMAEPKNEENTMTEQRVDNLMQLVADSNTGYLLVSGGGEGFIEPQLMYKIVEDTTAELTWMVTGAHWAKNKDRASKVIDNMYEAFQRGDQDAYNREICLRISLDSYHVDQVGQSLKNPLKYVENVIDIYDEQYADEENFTLQLHGIEDEKELADQLIENVGGKKLSEYDSFHDEVKVTEDAFTIRLESGYEFEITFAKYLHSDLATDLDDEENLEQSIDIFEKDAYENEGGRPAVKENGNGRIGPNMLVTYDGRVSFWQSEMPDVPIDIDSDDYEDILEKSFSDPGVLGTVEKGLKYRYDIVEEVSPKAVKRSKAVNIRDYTSLVLLEEDQIKLYYTIRALQDFVAESRVSEEDIADWPPGLQMLVNMDKETLQTLYETADYDIVQQFIEKDGGDLFGMFFEQVRQYATNEDEGVLLGFFDANPEVDARTVDKWRLLFERISNNWYNLTTVTEQVEGMAGEVEAILDEQVLDGQRIYEGLSARSIGAYS